MAGKNDNGERPLVVSLCGTYLKKEMQSLYRQIVGLEEHRNVVFAEKIANPELFPFDDVVQMKKRTRPRPRGNFLLRYWYKHVRKQWPPPRPVGSVGREGAYYHPYDLVDLLEAEKPDVVHCYYGHKAVKYLWMLQAAKLPYVISFHGVDVVKFVGEKGYLEKLRIAFDEAQLVMARSNSLLERLADLGCPREKLRLNRTPIPFGSIEFQERRPPADGRWKLVQACRLIPKKGIFTVLDALPRVLKRWPKLKYYLAGVGPSQYTEELAEAIRVRGLSENVEMLGWLDQDRLQDLYRESHLFLHPSQLTQDSDQEGVPNSMLEAMASGLPVVATFHGGIPEAVTHGVDGFLVPERSPDELAGALVDLMGDGDTLAEFSRKAAASALERFGFDSQIRNLEDIYREARGLERIGPDPTPEGFGSSVSQKGHGDDAADPDDAADNGEPGGAIALEDVG